MRSYNPGVPRNHFAGQARRPAPATSISLLLTEIVVRGVPVQPQNLARGVNQPANRDGDEPATSEVVDVCGNGAGQGKIVIHVCDENRKVSKDFRCDKKTLLEQMKYFEKFQSAGSDAAGATSLEDLDISVHCDIQIFEWLMRYLQKPQTQTTLLEVSNVISILISADYLQMPRLVDECVLFVRNHLLEVLRLPIDTNCISPAILKKLAGITQIEDLDEQKDRKDRLISKLYMKKLELMLDDENNALFRCVYCNKLFTRSQKSLMVCAKANIFIDFHGTVIAEHVADRSWDINKFVHFLRQQGGLSWKETYYKIWAHLVTLYCVECDRHFVAAEVDHCSFHSQKARFGCGSNSGKYACCGAPAIRFDTALRSDGCTAKSHRVASAEDQRLLAEVMKRIHIVAEPFLSEHNYSEKYKALEAQYLPRFSAQQAGIARSNSDALPLSKIQDSPPLVIMIHRYVATMGESCHSASEDEDDAPEEFDVMDGLESAVPGSNPTSTSGPEESVPITIRYNRGVEEGQLGSVLVYEEGAPGTKQGKGVLRKQDQKGDGDRAAAEAESLETGCAAK